MVPESFQLPVVLFSVSVLEALLSVPVRLTLPAEPLTVPRLAVLKLPPRFTVLPAPAVIVPVFDQLFALIDSVPPPVASAKPLLVKVALLMVSALALTLALIVPLLISVPVPLPLTTVPEPTRLALVPSVAVMFELLLPRRRNPPLKLSVMLSMVWLAPSRYRLPLATFKLWPTSDRPFLIKTVLLPTFKSPPV